MIQTIPYYQNQTLAYVDLGDPADDPILVQHGLIASIEDSALFTTLLQQQRRVICLARPGYGDSSPYAMQQIGEWGAIVGALIEQLQLTRVDVLGISSGAPYSYAIGYLWPAQVRTIYILSGTPALYDDAILAHWPHPVNKRATRDEMTQVAHEVFFAHLSPAARAQRDISDSLRNGGFGVAQDLYLRGRDWGFRLADVRTPVVMQHSQTDAAVPFVTAQLTAARLPRCTLIEKASAEHFSPALLQDLINTTMCGP
ncbi:MAG: alpha/beta hydrolase [Caldilineaceae bacterium]|nr:alpha/beta hydrolase [Caldilineaceae bacterium]